jgi:hypothetical protein
MSDINNDQAVELSKSIIRDFHFDPDNELVSIKHIEDLKRKLEKIVAYLLDNDFERLINAMYRLDIHEEKFKMALAGLSGGDVAQKVAELIIAREMQKIKTRKKYSNA